MSADRHAWLMDIEAGPPGQLPGSGDPPDPPGDDLLSPGDRIDQFKVVRLLGKGGMGEVYLARDTTLGRKVAVKVIRRHGLLSDDAVARFLFEARATATLSHPNIVTIFQAGQHHGRPYVVMEYLEGENLRARLRNDPPGQKEAIRLALAVARALTEAHSRQIVHRDLKPENLLIPTDGRLRVVDFGLARVMDRPLDMESSQDLARALSTAEQIRLDEPASVRGSPPYMAPEQWLQRDSSGPTDIWALGIVLHELLTGERPFEQFTFIELAAQVAGGDPVPLLLGAGMAPSETYPHELVALVRGCLEKEERARPTAAEVVEVLESLLTRGRSRLDSEASPFRGLAPFGEEHAEQFFGRDAELLEFLEKLRHQAVLPVVGPSGAGKSSFIQAGVIPRLREQGGWTVLRMRPGGAPFRALAARLAAGETHALPPRISPPDGSPALNDESIASPDPSGARLPSLQILETTLAEEEDLARELRDKPHLLSLALRRLASQQGGKVLLLVDQLEELNTLTAEEQERRLFMEAICGAADEESDPVRIIFTLREDFLSRLALGPLVRVIMSQLTVMRRPEARALKQTLTHPLELQGYRFDDDLLPAEMVQEVQGERAALPLLQFAARRMWEKRDRQNRLLRRADFESMGGVAGALARHADGVVDSLDTAEQEAARELLLRLVTPERTRQVVARDALLEGLGPGGEAVLQRLVVARLLTSRRGTGTTGGIELVHESLIHTWRRLARWLEESREDLIFLEEAGRAASLWESRGRRHAEVWAGQALLEAEAALARCAAKVPDQIGRFIAAGKRRRDRNAWRLRGLSVLLLLAMSLVAIVFYGQKQEAQKQRGVAQSQHARAEEQQRVAQGRLAESLLEGANAGLARGKRLEARARLRSAIQISDSITARGLWWQLSRDPLLRTHDLGGTVWDLAISPDGKTVAVACQDGAITLLDSVTGKKQNLRGFGDVALAVAFSPDGQTLAVATSMGQIHLRNLRGGPERLLEGHSRTVWTLAFNPDGKILASGGKDNTVRLHRLGGQRGVPLVLRAGSKGITSVTFSPDGVQLAASTNDGPVWIWRTSDGKQLHRMTSSDAETSDVAFNPAGDLLASVTGDHLTILWDPRTGARKAAFEDTPSLVTGVAFSPDGRHLATSSRDKLVRIWDLASGRIVKRLRGHTGWVRRVRYAPDGKTLVSGGYDNTVRLWRPGTGEQQRLHGGHTDSSVGLRTSPDGELLVSTGADHTVRIWDRKSGRLLKVISDLPGRGEHLDISPDGKTLAVVGRMQGVRLYSFPEGRLLQTLATDLSSVYSLALHPNGHHLAISAKSRIRLLDARTGEAIWTAKTGRTATMLRFNRQGSLLAGSLWDGEVGVWSGKTGAQLHRFQGHKNMARSVVFSPDSARVYSMGDDGTVRTWSLAGGPPSLMGPLAARAYHGDISADGMVLGVPLSDKTARLMGIDGRPLATLRGHRKDVNMVAFAPSADMPWAATSSDDGTVRLWDTRDGEPLWHTVLLAPTMGGVLTRTGWQVLAGDALAPGLQSRAWARAATKDGLLGALSSDGTDLCLVNRAGQLSQWDAAGDRRRFSAKVGQPRQLEATPRGCLVLANNEACLYREDGSFQKLSRAASAVAADAEGVLVLEQNSVLLFTQDGTRGARVKVGMGASAVGRGKGGLVVGYQEGSLEWFPLGSTEAAAPAPLEDSPSSAVERIIQGPGGTLVASFVSGEVGIWDQDNGNLLHAFRLHGPVNHIRTLLGKLHAASELGDHLTLDLAIFDQPYARLRAEVDKRVPVIWKDGRVQRAE